MRQKLDFKDWIRIFIGFILGVAVTILVMQLMGGGALLQGYLVLPSTTVKTTTTDTSLSDVIERLSSGERIDSAKDDPAGLILDDSRELTTQMVVR